MHELTGRAMAVVRASGGRMTAQRRLIWETLDAMGGHPTAEEVYHAVCERDASLNPSTVYRTLRWLEGAGLVSHRHLDTGAHGERCERFDPQAPTEHHHFICTGCGGVSEFIAPEIEMAKRRFAAEQGASVQSASLTLYGVCRGCRGDAAP